MMKVLFVHQGLATFVVQDLEILSEEYDVRVLHFHGLRDLFSLWQGVKWCEITFCWFCSPHTFFTVLFSKILRKKSVVVAGGYDVANEPEIEYGVYYGSSFLCRVKQAGSRLTFRLVDLVLSVSHYNMEEALRNAKVKPSKIRLVYHGFNHNKFRLLEDVKKETVVITIGNINHQSSPRKGHDLFIKAAKHLPQVRFIVVGKWQDDFIHKLRAEAPPNVEFVGKVKWVELLKIFSRARVYVQTSRHEGFGCALAEAMLCECIPVVSRRTALPEVAGDRGFYVDELTPEKVAVKIKEALSADGNLGKVARERIIVKFPLETRKRELINSLNSI